LGDHRDHSSDSRFFGSVAESSIVGEVKWVVLSWGPSGSAMGSHRYRSPVRCALPTTRALPCGPGVGFATCRGRRVLLEPHELRTRGPGGQDLPVDTIVPGAVVARSTTRPRRCCRHHALPQQCSGANENKTTGNLPGCAGRCLVSGGRS
jgi:hypothetical protein